MRMKRNPCTDVPAAWAHAQKEESLKNEKRQLRNKC